MKQIVMRAAAAAVAILVCVSAAGAADDIVVWRPRTGTWYSISSASGFAVQSAAATAWGSQRAGDVPLMADLDGDGIRDLIVWRASTGTWYWLTSSTGYNPRAAGMKAWGSKRLGDVPLTGDIDGDGRSDLVIWRASTGTWFWLTSSSGYNYAAQGQRQWGAGALGDVPMLADCDGDRRADLIVWRPATGTWYWLTAASGYNYAAAGARQWGSRAAGDVPRVGDIDGDGRADLVVWRASTGTWFWITSSTGYAYSHAGMLQWGSKALGDVPIVGDVDGDRRADLVVWRASSGVWFCLTSSSGFAYRSAIARQWGTRGDVPLVGLTFRSAAIAAPPPPPAAPPSAPAPAPRPEPVGRSGSELRVMQWNTHHGGYGTDGAYRPDRLATWAARIDPDVIMLNEIEKNDGWGNQDQPEVYKRLLEQKTGRTWYYVFARASGEWRSNGQGNLILSIYPFDAIDRYELTHGDRSLALAQITVAGRPITLLSTHIDPDSQGVRLAQAREITRWASAQPENRILAGDMNAGASQSSIAHFTSTYHDSWAVAASKGTAYAFPGNAGQTRRGRIDYIFYSRSSPNLSVKSSQVFDTRSRSGVMPSDHRPVLTTFVVR